MKTALERARQRRRKKLEQKVIRYGKQIRMWQRASEDLADTGLLEVVEQQLKFAQKRHQKTLEQLAKKDAKNV